MIHLFLYYPKLFFSNDLHPLDLCEKETTLLVSKLEISILDKYSKSSEIWESPLILGVLKYLKFNLFNNLQFESYNSLNKLLLYYISENYRS